MSLCRSRKIKKPVFRRFLCKLYSTYVNLRSSSSGDGNFGLASARLSLDGHYPFPYFFQISFFRRFQYLVINYWLIGNRLLLFRARMINGCHSTQFNYTAGRFAAELPVHDIHDQSPSRTQKKCPVTEKN